MQRIFTLFKSGKSFIPPKSTFYSIGAFSLIAFFSANFGKKLSKEYIRPEITKEIEFSACPNLEITNIQTTGETECGKNDGTLTIEFSDDSAGSSDYVIELARGGKPALKFGGFKTSPVYLENIYPGQFSIRVIRANDDCASPYVDQGLTSPCTDIGLRAPEEACGAANDLILYTNCENFTVYIPKNIIESNTFIFLDEDHVGCVAFVDENCEIQPSTRVYCADFGLEVPAWEITFLDADPFDGIPTVVSLVSYTKEGIDLTELQAARINYIMCHRDGFTDGQINDAIWGVLPNPAPPILPVACNELCQAAKENVPEGTNGALALETLVTYKSPDPMYQDFVELLAEDQCIDCFFLNVACFSGANDNPLTETCEVEVCPGETARFAPKPAGVLNFYSWVGPNGFKSTDSVITISNVSPLDTGTYIFSFDTCMEASILFNLGLISAPAVEISKTDPACGAANGSITFTFGDDPGRDSLQFSLNGGAGFLALVPDNAGSVTYNDLTEGDYQILVQWAGGACPQELGTVSLVSSTAPTADAGADQFLCEGGTVKLEGNATGGTAPYRFTWSAPDGVLQEGTTKTLEVVTNETTLYTLLVTDSLGCTDTDSVLVTIAAEKVDVALSKTDVGCKGESTGSVVAVATGGMAPYAFSWNTGATTDSITGVPAGTYAVTITDNNGCTATDAVQVNEPQTELTIAMTNSNGVKCVGDSTASVQVAATGGTPEYTFSWNTGATGSQINNIPAGRYTVTVTDANNCTATLTVNIMDPAPLAITFTSQDVECDGEANGMATAVVTGGTGTYGFIWDIGETTAKISNLAPGTYTVTVTDENDCQASASVIIRNVTNGLGIQIDEKLDVVCFGEATGKIAASGVGGMPPYTFSWSNGDSTSVADSLTAGDYTLILTDANGCTTDTTVTINQPLEQLIISDSLVSNIVCAGDANGAISIKVSGGTSPYTYLWNTGADTDNISNLVAGTYSVTVTDSNGCIVSAQFEISEPDPLVVSVLASSDVICFGFSGGSADIEISGGTPEYSILWSNGATSASINDLNPGTYSVTVTDANQCTATTSVTINQPEEIIITLVDSKNPSCQGVLDGSITVEATGGVGTLTFNWDNGSSGASIDSLTDGTYTVTVTDENGCTATDLFDLTAPTPISLSVDTLIHVACKGEATGSATISTSGEDKLSILWSTGDTTATIDGLLAGDYGVTVSNSDGCAADTTITILEPENAVEVKIASTGSVDCSGNSEGALIAEVTGGTAPYTFMWDSGETGDTIMANGAGTYKVLVTDANGCTASDSVTIIAQGGIAINILAQTDILCNGELTGVLSVEGTGGTSPYNYTWSTGDTTAMLSGLAAGEYGLTVTDANGCFADTTLAIAEPDKLVVTVETTDVLCMGEFTGSAQVTARGGTAPYSYEWSFGSDIEDFDGIGAGTYVLTVTDANGCIDSTTVVINEPTALSAEAVATEIGCVDENGGSVDLTVSGGVLPYSYLWSNGTTTEDLEGVAAGTYMVTVTDAGGCTITAAATVNEIKSNIMGFTNIMLMENCKRETVAMVRASAIGGTPPYSYSWSTGETTQVIGDLPEGNYYVTITDANGCFTEKHVCILIEQKIKYGGKIAGDQVICGSDAAPDPITNVDLPYFAGTSESDFVFSWKKSTSSCEDFRLWGLDWEEIPNANKPYYHPGALTESTFFIRYAWNKKENKFYESNIVYIEVLDKLTVDAGYDIFSCEGQDIELTATVKGGGSADYTYTWSHGLGEGPSKTVAPNTTTTYSVTVTNKYGCSARDEVKIITRPGPSINAFANLGPDDNGIFCEGDVVQLEARIGQGATAATWKTSGDGTFSDANSLITEYTIGSKEAALGIVVLTATTSKYYGTCPAASDVVELSVNAPSSQACLDRNFMNHPEGTLEREELAFDEIRNPDGIKVKRDDSGAIGQQVEQLPIAKQENPLSEVILYQNTPNPFVYETKIGFELPENGYSRLSIFDQYGKVIKVIQGNYAKGFNEITLDRGALPNGILYYSIEMNGQRVIKKMLIFEQDIYQIHFQKRAEMFNSPLFLF